MTNKMNSSPEDARYSPDFTSVPAEKIFYALTMFPYPSGIGLHCGHASVFTINDVVARFKRMQGYTVFNPFGFDAFGLPTENYAMELGKPAYEVTEENEKMFIDQVKALNLSFDRMRVIDTSKPDYYKWTQRIFQQLYKAWLVYRASLRVNRCPEDQTVLANDQVVDGRCERCKTEVVQKKVPQRFIKITAYADRLIQDLETIDRPEETKIAQRNWIGRSEGAEIDFDVDGINAPTIKVFTTRPDTLFGVTAVVLAPENTLIDSLLDADKKAELDNYRQATFAKTPIQRQQELKEKTGIFSWAYVIHPLTWEQLPIRFADYVVADYGSGAVMMVPAHDERDFEFAKKFQIEIKPVIEGEIFEWTQVVREWVLINSWRFDWLSHLEAKEKIAEHLASLNKGWKKITYRLRDRSVSRQRYRGSPIPVYYSIPQEKVYLFEYQDAGRKHKEGQETLTREVIQLIVKDKNSDEYCFVKWNFDDGVSGFFGGIEAGETAEDAAKRELLEEGGFTHVEIKKHILDYQCKFRHPTKNRNQYSVCTCLLIEVDRAHQKDISKAEKEQHSLVWMSAEEFLKVSNNDTTIYCLNHLLGKEQKERQLIDKYNDFYPCPEDKKIVHLIPEDELPVELPLDVKNYKPKGKSPLEEHPTFAHYHKDGKEYLRECDTLDTFMCSSFYFLRFPEAHNPKELISKWMADKLFPINFYSWGKEHTVGHLLYSRLIHKFLYDQGYVPSPEPFEKLIHQWMVLGKDGRKMSKRYKNGVDPMEMIEQYGSDALRTYLMFMGPVEADKQWNNNALQGVKKFLERIQRLFDAERKGTFNEEVESMTHQTIRDLTKDLEEMKFNTAVSKLMILVNSMYDHQAVTDEQLWYLTLLLAPFAPECAEQMRKKLWHQDDVHYASRPVENPEKILQGMISLPVQINGKMRWNIEVQPGIDEANVLKMIREDEKINKHLEWQNVKKVIYVQDKILNIVVE